MPAQWGQSIFIAAFESPKTLTVIRTILLKYLPEQWQNSWESKIDELKFDPFELFFLWHGMKIKLRFHKYCDLSVAGLNSRVEMVVAGLELINATKFHQHSSLSQF